MDLIQISGRRIGHGQPCFIIAEAGVNHNGNWRRACDLVDAAQAAGADAVKFQTWVTERLVLPEAILANYQKRNVAGAGSQFELLKALELSGQDFRRISAYAKKRGLLFLSTPDEESSADFLEKLGVPLFKIGSGEVTNLPYLRYLARKGRPLILSTGMSTLGEVEAALEAIEQEGNPPLALLHCVSNYPAAPSACNLAAMGTLRSAFGRPVGWSDHTLGHDVAIAAVALGACLLEKHLTLDTGLEGPDHRASLDPAQFAAMVRAVRDVESALGDGRKRPTPSELETKRVVQKSLVTARAIRKGETLEPSALALRRTSGGLPPSALPLVVGRRARRQLPPWTVVTLEALR